MSDKRDDWKLKKISLEFQTFGEDKGKYVGQVMFQNGEFESFNFKIRPEMGEKYIDMIASDVVIAAEQLGSRLIESLNLKERIK